MDVTLRYLFLLRVVAEAGSVREAARRSGLSQPTLSRQLARLESELGVQLLRRSSAGVVLTEAGATASRRAARIADEIAGMRAALDALAGRRLCRLAVGPSLGPGDVAPVLARAGYQVHATVVPEPEAFDRLNAGEVDLVLAVDHPDVAFHPEDGVACEPLAPTQLWLALPAGHRCAGCPTVALPDLRGEDWLLPPDGSVRALTEQACAAAGFAPRRRLVADTEVRLEAVADGAGVTLVTAADPVVHGYRLAVRPIHPPVRQRSIVAWRREALDALTTERLVAAVRRRHDAVEAIAPDRGDGGAELPRRSAVAGTLRAAAG